VRPYSDLAREIMDVHVERESSGPSLTFPDDPIGWLLLGLVVALAVTLVHCAVARYRLRAVQLASDDDEPAE
jgi:hypothetical protein